LLILKKPEATEVVGWYLGMSNTYYKYVMWDPESLPLIEDIKRIVMCHIDALTDINDDNSNDKKQMLLKVFLLSISI